MNKIKALVTTLVLGTSAAAFAAPTATVEYNRGPDPTAPVEYNTQDQRDWRAPMDGQRDWREPMPAPAPVTFDRDRDRDGDRDGDRDRELMFAPEMERDGGQYGGHWHHRTQWTTLAGSAKIWGSAEYIRVGRQAGRFDKLELKRLSGKTQINFVKINFANGQSQWARLDTTLDRNNPITTIDLNGQHRSISSIVVYGSGSARSSYSILAA